MSQLIQRAHRWWGRNKKLRWGNMRRLEPVSRVFGYDRGTCIDRYFIKAFLSRHAADIRGHVLEVGDNQYTVRFGGPRVVKSHILHVSPGAPGATIIGDLSRWEETLASWTGVFDCIVLTQTLPFIYRFSEAVRGAFALLKWRGVLLATVPGISQISRFDADRWGDYWRFTPQSVARLLGDVYGPKHVEVESFGNVLVACAFMHGLAAEELAEHELQHRDQDYPVVICTRAVKAKDV